MASSTSGPGEQGVAEVRQSGRTKVTHLSHTCHLEASSLRPCRGEGNRGRITPAEPLCSKSSVPQAADAIVSQGPAGWQLRLCRDVHRGRAHASTLAPSCAMACTLTGQLRRVGQGQEGDSPGEPSGHQPSLIVALPWWVSTIRTPRELVQMPVSRSHF